MCFYVDDVDWYAEVQEEEIKDSNGHMVCQECSRWLPKNEPFHYIYQQESEECKTCLNGECECHSTEDCCECTYPDYGEYYEWWSCRDCYRFLECIRQAELEEGCRDRESRPLLGMMVESLRDIGPKDCKRYWTKVKDTKEYLIDSGYLPWLWKELFGGT